MALYANSQTSHKSGALKNQFEEIVHKTKIWLGWEDELEAYPVGMRVLPNLDVDHSPMEFHESKMDTDRLPDHLELDLPSKPKTRREPEPLSPERTKSVLR